MKLIIKNDRIIGTATDAYIGPDEFIAAPTEFIINRMHEYTIANSVAVLPARDIQAEIVTLVQANLDDFAKTRNYDGILSACTYATSSIPKFASEGQYCVNARDNTWTTLYTIMAEVEAGTRPIPTSFTDIEPELPVLTWPT